MSPFPFSSTNSFTWTLDELNTNSLSTYQVKKSIENITQLHEAFPYWKMVWYVVTDYGVSGYSNSDVMNSPTIKGNSDFSYASDAWKQWFIKVTTQNLWLTWQLHGVHHGAINNTGTPSFEFSDSGTNGWNLNETWSGQIIDRAISDLTSTGLNTSTVYMFKGAGYSGSGPLWKALGERNFTVVQFEASGQFFSLPFRCLNDKIIWVLYDEFFPQDLLAAGTETIDQLVSDFNTFAQRGTQIITAGHDGPLNTVVNETIQVYQQIENKYPYLYYVTTNDLVKYYDAIKAVTINSFPWSDEIVVSNSPPQGLSFMMFPSTKNVESSSEIGRDFRLTVSDTNTTLKFGAAKTAHVYASSCNLTSHYIQQIIPSSLTYLRLKTTRVLFTLETKTLVRR
jgi:hypothetical protein